MPIQLYYLIQLHYLHIAALVYFVRFGGTLNGIENHWILAIVHKMKEHHHRVESTHSRWRGTRGWWWRPRRGWWGHPTGRCRPTPACRRRSSVGWWSPASWWWAGSRPRPSRPGTRPRPYPSHPPYSASEGRGGRRRCGLLTGNYSSNGEVITTL